MLNINLQRISNHKIQINLSGDDDFISTMLLNTKYLVIEENQLHNVLNIIVRMLPQFISVFILFYIFIQLYKYIFTKRKEYGFFSFKMLLPEQVSCYNIPSIIFIYITYMYRYYNIYICIIYIFYIYI